MGFVTKASEILAFLRSKGFTIETGRGRHGTKAVKGGLRIPIPMHSRDLTKFVTGNILRMAGHSVDDLIEWRRQ